MAATGLDQSWGFADPATAARYGIKVISMYLSWDTSKNITASDVRAYHHVGIALILNWESQAGAPLKGAAQGKLDAQEAVRQAKALIAAMGYAPRNRPIIYFSCDTDVYSSQFSTIGAYYRAAKDVCAAAGFGVGVYGEASLVSWLHQQGITDAEWQTYAWSGGVLSPDADFYQYLNGQTLGGASVDFDQVIHPAELGAWWPPGHQLDSATGVTTTMDLASVKQIFNTDNIIPAPPDSGSYATNKFWSLASHIAGITVGVRGTLKIVSTLPGRLAQLQASVAALDAKVTSLQQTGGVTISGEVPATLHIGAKQ